MKTGHYNPETISKFIIALDEQRERIRRGEILHVSISHGNTKTGPVASVSLLPYLTCPGCCAETCGPDCYAGKLANLRPTVLQAWARNTAILLERPAQFWEEVRQAVAASRYFRFHVSGDIPSREYLAEMIQTAKDNPGTEILAFTKRFGWIAETVEAEPLPKNLHVLLSGWTNLQPLNPHNLPETNVYGRHEEPRPSWLQCGGNCFSCACRGVGCWQAGAGDVIAFRLH